MNNIVNMVKYYLIHKNADDSVIEYLKNKIGSTSIEDLIVIQIELLFTDPSDSLVSNLVSLINNMINNILKDYSLYDLANLTSILNYKVTLINQKIEKLNKQNDNIFNTIKSEDFVMEINDDETKDQCAARLINKTQDNLFNIKKYKSETNSINIWLKNLENSYNKKLKNTSIEEIIKTYIQLLVLINRDSYINKFIENISIYIDDKLLNNNILELIINVMPELNELYKNYSKEKSEIYKLLDYYVDMADNKIKNIIYKMEYEEKLILKEKINIIINEILTNDNPNDDFKVLVINSYLRYL